MQYRVSQISSTTFNAPLNGTETCCTLSRMIIDVGFNALEWFAFDTKGIIVKEKLKCLKGNDVANFHY